MVHREEPDGRGGDERADGGVPEERPEEEERGGVDDEQAEEADDDLVLRLRLLLVLDELRGPARRGVRGRMHEERGCEEGETHEHGERVAHEEREQVEARWDWRGALRVERFREGQGGQRGVVEVRRLQEGVICEEAAPDVVDIRCYVGRREQIHKPVNNISDLMMKNGVQLTFARSVRNRRER